MSGYGIRKIDWPGQTCILIGMEGFGKKNMSMTKQYVRRYWSSWITSFKWTVKL